MRFCIKRGQADRRNGKRSTELAAVMVPKDEIIIVVCRGTAWVIGVGLKSRRIIQVIRSFNGTNDEPIECIPSDGWTISLTAFFLPRIWIVPSNVQAT